MSEEQPSSKRPFWPWIVGLCAFSPVVYVGSFGPVVWLLIKSMSAASGVPTIFQYVMVVYVPLILLGYQFEPVGDFLNWYVRLFDSSITVVTKPITALPPLPAPGPVSGS